MANGMDPNVLCSKNRLTNLITHSLTSPFKLVSANLDQKDSTAWLRPGGGTRSEKWWVCAAGRWKLDPKRSREKWNLGPKRSKSVRIGSFNTTKDRFGVGGWEKIPQKDRARSCQSEKRGSKPRHICITHHIGSTPPGVKVSIFLGGDWTWPPRSNLTIPGLTTRVNIRSL